MKKPNLDENLSNMDAKRKMDEKIKCG